LITPVPTVTITVVESVVETVTVSGVSYTTVVYTPVEITVPSDVTVWSTEVTVTVVEYVYSPTLSAYVATVVSYETLV
jgi:uncharacterized membrane protein